MDITVWMRKLFQNGKEKFRDYRICYPSEVVARADTIPALVQDIKSYPNYRKFKVKTIPETFLDPAILVNCSIESPLDYTELEKIAIELSKESD